jgi:hypothetical protein
MFHIKAALSYTLLFLRYSFIASNGLQEKVKDKICRDLFLTSLQQ